MKKILDTELLRIFCTVSHFGQMNIAARHLGISTSAVSQTIKKLEEFLNTEVFVHEQRPLKLTTAGARLFREGQPIVQALESLQSVYNSLEMPQTSLRLGMGETVTATISPWLVSEIQKKIAHLEVHSNLNIPLTEKLKNGLLDICVYSEGLLNESDWMRIPVYEEEYLVVSSKRLGNIDTIGKLRDVAFRKPYVSYTISSHDRNQVDRFLSSLNIVPRTQIQTGSSYCLTGLVDLCDGWTLLPATNLWSGGQFSHVVVWNELPKEYKFGRRTWVLGTKKKTAEIHWIADMTRSMFINHTLPELQKISPDLLKHAYILPYG